MHIGDNHVERHVQLLLQENDDDHKYSIVYLINEEFHFAQKIWKNFITVII